MKNIYFLLILISSIACLISCKKLAYTGDYSKDGLYTANRKVYFGNKEPVDSLLNYSFSTTWIDHKRQIVLVPVNMAGTLSEKPLNFKLVVDEKLSTAKPNVHFTPLANSYQIPANATSLQVPIELWRDSLSSTKYDSIKLVLRLESTDDLKVTFPELQKKIITFDDYLAEPYYWVYRVYYWGPFSQIKFRKFLEYFDSDITKFETALTEDFNGLSMKFVQVYNFFKAHPEYNQILPDNLYIPYK